MGVASRAGQQPLSLTIGAGGNPWFSEIVPAAGGGVASSATRYGRPGQPCTLRSPRSDPSGRRGARSSQDHGRSRRYDLVHRSSQRGDRTVQSVHAAVFTSLPIRSSSAPKAQAFGITNGPDGNVWFTVSSDASGHSDLGAVSHATHLVIPGPWEPPATVKAGTPFTVTAVAADSFGNPDPGYSGTATLSLAPSGSVDGTSSAVASGGFFSFPAVIVNSSGTAIRWG